MLAELRAPFCVKKATFADIVRYVVLPSVFNDFSPFGPSFSPLERKQQKFSGVLFELLNAQEPPKSDFSAPKSLPRAIFERKVALPRPTLGPPGSILDAK